MPTYRELQKVKYQKNIDDLISILPFAVRVYVIAMESTVSPHTLYEYLYCLNRFFTFIHDNNPVLKKKPVSEISYEDIDRITADDIDEFLHTVYQNNLDAAHPEKAKKTRNHYLSPIRSFFSFLFSRDKIKANVVEKIERSKYQKKQEVVKLDQDEEKRMMSTVQSGIGLSDRVLRIRDNNNLMTARDEAIIQVLLRTGIRVSELVGLDVKHIHFDQHCFTIQRKRDKPDIVYMDDETEDILRSYIKLKNALSSLYKMDKDAVFIVTVGKYFGQRMSVRSVQLLVKKYAVAGVPETGYVITPHRLRATFATDLLRASDGDIKFVQEALAHESIQTTLIYTGNDTSDKRKYRNLLKNESDADKE